MNQKIAFIIVFSMSSIYGMQQKNVAPTHENHRTAIKNYFHHLYPINPQGQGLVTAYHNTVEKKTFILVQDAALNHSFIEILETNRAVRKNMCPQQYHNCMHMLAHMTAYNRNSKALNLAQDPVIDDLLKQYML